MLDLHVHTCLSPCGDLDMHPAGLAAAARAAGLDGVAVCDHNSAANAAAVVRAGRAVDLAVIPGLEIASEEEVHVLAWLPDVPSAEGLQRQVYGVLPGRNDERAFGQQVVVTETGEVTGFDERLLIGATTWPLDRVVAEIHAAGGLAVAAHVDRERFGLVGQLGFVPPRLAADAVEVSARTTLAEGRARYAGGATPVVTASDAHAPAEVGRAVTYWLLDRPDRAEIGLALREAEGRALLGGGRPMEDLSLHILDVARNAVEAGATRVEIAVEEDLAADRLLVEIRDNGRGMEPEMAARATDPFFTTRTTRRVGLGLSLLAAAARAAGGELTIESAPGRGTRVRATFAHGHVDRAPLGDIETTVMVLAAGSPEVDLVFRHAVGGGSFELDTRDLRSVLGGEPLGSPAGIKALREAVRRGEAALHGRTHAGKGAA
jgi:anti-sigma regulatory factor (Ser/Thr protein kinase)